MPKAHARETNVEFVTRLMEESTMGNLVVIEALTKYTGKIIANEAEVLKSFGGHQLISGPGWVATCKEIAAEIEAKYGPSGNRSIPVEV